MDKLTRGLLLLLMVGGCSEAAPQPETPLGVTAEAVAAEPTKLPPTGDEAASIGGACRAGEPREIPPLAAMQQPMPRRPPRYRVPETAHARPR